MPRVRSAIGIAVLCAALASMESLATATSADGAASTLGTVVVEGRRATLTELKLEIDRLDDAFYERFNELNTVPEYETHCFLHAPLGTRIQKRYCHPVFVDAARREVASMVLQSVTSGSGVDGGGAVQISLQAVSEHERSKYLKHLIETTLRHPELLSLREQRAKVIRDYESERRKSAVLQPRRKQAPDRSP
jgi:hypothetical protein